MLPFFTHDQAALQAQVRLWTEANLFAGHGSEDLDRCARDAVSQLGAAGFLRHVVSKQFGGTRQKVQARDLCILREELARGDALTDTMFALQALGSYPITLAGSVAHKQSYLPLVASGDAIAAFAITEPEAGSDVASLQTTALRRGEHFVLNGTKRFISNAGIADFYVVFAS
ncbi:MAG TPA: acyl-CoA dehydrogenase family protein, partial [Candidatus Limnocylindria bacterium]|nr:acyl-CoA dehydrogenase family protein [Candidatus Limnocylindria bacterium]